MSKRENKRIRQLERRVEKLERTLYGKRGVPDYEIQITAAGTPEMLDDMGTKLAKVSSRRLGKPRALRNRQNLCPWSSSSPLIRTSRPKKPAKLCMRC